MAEKSNLITLSSYLDRPMSTEKLRALVAELAIELCLVSGELGSSKIDIAIRRVESSIGGKVLLDRETP